MKTLVIGGTGFIGMNIVAELQAQGHEVTVTRRPSSNTLFVRKLKPNWVEADCSDFVSLKKAMQNQEAVFMAAGHYPRYSVAKETQVVQAKEMITNVLNAAQESSITKLVYTSSSSTYFSKQPRSSVYFQVKKVMEYAVLDAISKGLPAIVLCPSGCLGPGDVKAGTGSILINTVKNKLPFYAEGNINFVDVKNVAKVHVAAIKAQTTRPRYLVSGSNLSMTDYFKLMAKIYHCRIPPKVPLFVASQLSIHSEHLNFLLKKKSTIPLEFVEILRYGEELDNSLTRKELLDYKTDLEGTITECVQWYQKHKYIK